MKIPQSINDLTLNQFIKLEQIKAQKYEFEIDKAIKVCSLFTGVPSNEIEKYSNHKATNILKTTAHLTYGQPSLKRKNYIWIANKRYKAVKNEKHLDANQYTCQKVYEINSVANIHKLCSVFYLRTPIFKKQIPFDNPDLQETQADFYKHATIGQVYGTVFFYNSKSETQNLISQLYLMTSQEEISLHMKEVYQELQSLGVNMDGSISSIKSQAEAVLKEIQF